MARQALTNSPWEDPKANSPAPADLSHAEKRLLNLIRMDLAAMLRGYFPVEVARELSEECEALVRGRVKAGQTLRRVSLTPSTYSRPRSKASS